MIVFHVTEKWNPSLRCRPESVLLFAREPTEFCGKRDMGDFLAGWCIQQHSNGRVMAFWRQPFDIPQKGNLSRNKGYSWAYICMPKHLAAHAVKPAQDYMCTGKTDSSRRTVVRPSYIFADGLLTTLVLEWHLKICYTCASVWWMSASWRNTSDLQSLHEWLQNVVAASSSTWIFSKPGWITQSRATLVRMQYAVSHELYGQSHMHSVHVFVVKGDVHPKMKISYLLVFGALSRMLNVRGACHKPVSIYKGLNMCVTPAPGYWWHFSGGGCSILCYSHHQIITFPAWELRSYSIAYTGISETAYGTHLGPSPFEAAPQVLWDMKFSFLGEHLL